MSNEKPFEIMQHRDIITDELMMGVCESHQRVLDYWNRANAEIRLLQKQVLGFERETADWQLEVASLREQLAARPSLQQWEMLCKESDHLKSELADAPTWGEWMDATAENLNNSARLPTVPYEVEGTDGETWISMNGFIRFTLDDNAVRFRRLNYEPKPAREVEKKYTNSDGGEFTLTQLSKIDSYIVGELAADLLTLQEKHAAAQAELRELKGASDAESK